MRNTLISSVLLCSVALAPLLSFAQSRSEDQAVVTYARDYFLKYEPVTLLDMLQRVPGAQAIIDKSRSQNNNNSTNAGGKSERGFGSGGDQILINNKRLSGKANSIGDTLARISATTVERVEIIRGASSDLDVQSQGLVINVIMATDADSSSTFWKVGGRYSETYIFSPDILVSHNGSKGNLDYILGASYKHGQHIDHRFDQVFTPDNVFTGEATRRSNNLFKTLKLNGNLTFNAENGDEFRLNGQFEPADYKKKEPRTKTPLNQPTEFQNWREDQKSEKWEFGGDYTKRLGANGTWKTLFIANRDRIDKQENFSISDVPNFRNDQYRVKQEKILRSSLTTALTDKQIIEVGGEAAINKFDKIFTNENYVSGSYFLNVNDDVQVKENRYEVFVNHTYNISQKMVLQTSLTGEFSKISSVTKPLVGENINRSKNFNFLKPRFDFRYDFTGSDQLRASVEKKVSQLDFQNFVATYDAGNDILRLGNTGIVPEKSWNYSIAYEHRLPNDAGVAQLELFYRDISDYIDLVDFTEFKDGGGDPIARADIVPISKSGNIAKAKSYGLNASGSLRLGFIGLPEAVFSADYKWEKTEVIDNFSGINRSFKWTPEHVINLNFRHDITKWNVSYGAKGTIKSWANSYEINLFEDSYNGDLYEVFVELKIGDDLKLIFLFEHLTPRRYDVTTRYYNDHIRYNDLNRFELRKWKYVREYSVFLQGTF